MPCSRLPFIPATLDGFPCCWLYDDDLQGMGIPAGGLPAALRDFSLNGWSLGFDAAGKVKMYPGPQTKWERGCRGYLEANYENVAAGLKAWEVYCREWK